MTTGNAIGERLRVLTGMARENAILNAIGNGEYPAVFRDGPWRDVIVQGGGHVLQLRVAPDFFALGTADDPYYVGLTPIGAQRLANSLHSILPSKKLATDIAKHAGKLLSLYEVNPGAPWYDTATGIPKNIEATGAWSASNKKRNSKLMGPGRWARLTAGHMKDVITSFKGLGGSCPSKTCVTIFGGAGGSNDGWAIQPKSTIHDWNYGPDYSHGVRLVSRHAVLDGAVVDLVDVFKNPALAALVSDEGPFDPRLPLSATAGSGSTGGSSSGGGALPVPGVSTGIPKPTNTSGSGSSSTYVEAGSPVSGGGFFALLILGLGLVAASVFGGD